MSDSFILGENFHVENLEKVHRFHMVLCVKALATFFNPFFAKLPSVDIIFQLMYAFTELN